MDLENLSRNSLDRLELAFPNAEAFVFYKGDDPIHDILEKQYGKIYFLISECYGIEPERYLFYMSDPLYFPWLAIGTWNIKPMRHVVAYGSLDCLMISKEERHGKWKELICDFFDRCKPYEERRKIVENLTENEDVCIDFWTVSAKNVNGVLIEENDIEMWKS